MATVEDAIATIAPVEGWLTHDQARALWRLASSTGGGGTIVEIGSYRGRSTILLALAAPQGVEVVAIDPHAGNDRGPRQIAARPEQGEVDRMHFVRNLSAAGVNGRVRHLRLPAQAALGALDTPPALLYVDGAHRYRPARDDIARWGGRVADGGSLAIHDAFSSIGVTLAILRLLVAGRRFRYVGRTGSLAEYRREDLHGRRRLRNAVSQLAQLPWFARNVAIKVALVARLRPLARLLGHRGGTWPY